MSATIVSDLQVSMGSTPLDASTELPVLCDVEVDLGVQQQGMVRLQLGAGQDAGGDWARGVLQKYPPGTSITVDVRIGDATQRLLNGVLTLTKLHLSADLHESRVEVTGMDVLEKVKRSHNPQKYQGDLSTIVSQVLDRQHIPLDSTHTPIVGTITESQSDSDLDFLATLARKYNCEIYVESSSDGDTAFFQTLDFDQADLGPSALSTRRPADLRINQGFQSNVHNAEFTIDLSGPTRVEANNIDKNGKAAAQKIYSDLRDKPGLSQFERDMLPSPDFALISRLNREGQVSAAELQRRCDAELDKSSWVVIGKGELDTAAYGDLLYPRRAVTVRGAGSLFEGTYMVWKVTHSFKRDVHCQRFELRRKLGMMQDGWS
jgi:phage protein D